MVGVWHCDHFFRKQAAADYFAVLHFMACVLCHGLFALPLDVFDGLCASKGLFLDIFYTSSRLV